VLPLLLLAAGAFLSFLATGLEFLPLARGAMNVPAFLVFAGGHARNVRLPAMPKFGGKAAKGEQIEPSFGGDDDEEEDDEDDDEEEYDEDEEEEAEDEDELDLREKPAG